MARFAASPLRRGGVRCRAAPHRTRRGRRRGRSPSRYLELFRSAREQLLSEGAVPDHVLLDTTWQVSLDQLQQDDAAAVQLLRHVAFLAADPFPVAVLADQEPTILPGPLHEVLADPVRRDRTLGALHRDTGAVSTVPAAGPGAGRPPAGRGTGPPSGGPATTARLRAVGKPAARRRGLGWPTCAPPAGPRSSSPATLWAAPCSGPRVSWAWPWPGGPRPPRPPRPSPPLSERAREIAGRRGRHRLRGRLAGGHHRRLGAGPAARHGLSQAGHTPPACWGAGTGRAGTRRRALPRRRRGRLTVPRWRCARRAPYAAGGGTPGWRRRRVSGPDRGSG